jgi:hypothetical protein
MGRREVLGHLHRWTRQFLSRGMSSHASLRPSQMPNEIQPCSRDIITSSLELVIIPRVQHTASPAFLLGHTLCEVHVLLCSPLVCVVVLENLFCLLPPRRMPEAPVIWQLAHSIRQESIFCELLITEKYEIELRS